MDSNRIQNYKYLKNIILIIEMNRGRFMELNGVSFVVKFGLKATFFSKKQFKIFFAGFRADFFSKPDRNWIQVEI